MGKAWRLAWWMIGGVVGLFAIAWIALNLYVQSEGTQARIQQELSQRTGASLHIRSISATPWGGLTLSGITVPPLSPANSSSDFLDAKSFYLHVRLLSLFSKRVVINKVSLVAPTVVWPQDSAGRWRLPGPSATAAPPARTTKPADASRSAANRPHLVPQVRRVKMTDGNFKFLDPSGQSIAAFQGVNFHCAVRSPLALDGTAKVGTITLRDRFFVADFRSPLHYESAGLALPKISARIGKGDVHAKFALQPEAADSPFTLNVNFRNVEADQVVSDAGGPKGMLRGKLDGKLDAAGKTADPNAVTGSGEIILRDGQLQQYSLLVALGQVLQIEELTQLRLEQAEAKYHFGGGVVTVDQLVLRSPNMRLSATGSITFDGKLQLDSQLAINDNVREKLFKPIRENFQPTNEPGYAAVDFQVGGTLDRPKSNLVDKMVGRDLKDFVSGLLGGKKAKKKKLPESLPPAAELPTPEPPAPLEPPAPTATGTPPSP